MTQEQHDSLQQIFKMQIELNDFCFASNGITDTDGLPLSCLDIYRQVLMDRTGPNDLPNIWLGRYATAMEDELRELRESLLWKWWSKDTIDLQNVRVELIDILHFLVSAMIAAGMGSQDVLSTYTQKHTVNVKRQESGYSKETKTEAENRTIVPKRKK